MTSLIHKHVEVDYDISNTTEQFDVNKIKMIRWKTCDESNNGTEKMFYLT